MIGDNLSRRSVKRLKTFGSLLVASFYLLCLAQGEKLGPYLSIAPLVFSVWFGGLLHYKQPRPEGKIANFAMPIGTTTRPLEPRIIPRSPPEEGFSRGHLIDLNGGLDIRGLENQDGLLVRREIPPPGGQDFQYASSVRVIIKAKKDEIALEPPIRMSRYKKVSDPESWVV